MTSSDGNVKLKESKRESFTGWDWEEIEIKPPIDLIPDEFTRESNDNVLVEIVCSLDDGDAKEFKETLEDLGYSVNETDKDRQRMEKNVDDNWLKAVIKKTEEREYDGLIMIFAKVNYSNEEMKNIWSQFTSKDCPKLKNKPKIFLFQIIKRSPDADYTATSLNWLAPYETPAEADILIVNDRYDPDISRDLMQVLSDNIESYGYREDIISLISIDSNPNNHPMIMSTMTRKFFFLKHEHRGHHHIVFEKQDKIKEHITKVKEIKHQSATVRKSPPAKKRFSFPGFKGFTKRSPVEEKPKKWKPNSKTKEVKAASSGLNLTRLTAASAAKSDSTSKAPSTHKNSSKKQDNKPNIMEGGSNKGQVDASDPNTARNNEPDNKTESISATSSRLSAGKEKRSSANISSQSQRSSRKYSTASSVSITSTSSKHYANTKPPWRP